MMTRRTAIGAGIAFASLTGAGGLAAFGPSMQRCRDMPSINALLVDKTVEMPRQLTALVQVRGQTVPVIGIQLDAAAHAGLRRILDSSHVIAGISSGATLFCLERIAWDHGYRLTGRSEHCAGSLDDDASRQRLIAFLNGVYPSGEGLSALDRVYRPSRADGILHAWIMQKSAGRQSLQTRREIVV
jgi:hypothetical protein